MSTTKTLLVAWIHPPAPYPDVDQTEPANAMADTMQFDIDGTHNGIRSFTVELFGLLATDDSKPLAKWCAALLAPANRTIVGNVVPAQFPGAFVGDYDVVADPDYPNRILLQLGLRRAKATL